MWEDSVIDKEAKRFLKLKENGRYLPLDMVSHLDFFYNTLLVSHETVNPFRRTKVFEALLFPLFYKGMLQSGECEEGNTIIDIHRRLIHPLQFE